MRANEVRNPVRRGGRILYEPLRFLYAEYNIEHMGPPKYSIWLSPFVFCKLGAS